MYYEANNNEKLTEEINDFTFMLIINVPELLYTLWKHDIYSVLLYYYYTTLIRIKS